MKTLTEYLYFHTKTHRAYVHITPQVEEILRKSGVKLTARQAPSSLAPRGAGGSLSNCVELIE
jgi:hypothetical protein